MSAPIVKPAGIPLLPGSLVLTSPEGILVPAGDVGEIPPGSRVTVDCWFVGMHVRMDPCGDFLLGILSPYRFTIAAAQRELDDARVDYPEAQLQHTFMVFDTGDPKALAHLGEIKERFDAERAEGGVQ